MFLSAYFFTQNQRSEFEPAGMTLEPGGTPESPNGDATTLCDTGIPGRLDHGGTTTEPGGML